MSSATLILGIESTCDETAAAIVRDGREVLSNVVATQVELHAKYRGVVPEIASRAHIENIVPVIRESLEQSQTQLREVDAIAVAYRPGLIGSLLIGVTAAKTLAWALGKPLIGVDHVHGHLYSVMLGEGSGFRVQGSEESDEGVAPSLATSADLSTQHSALSTPTLNPSFPAVGLVVSGGHTALYRIDSFFDVQLIGSTIDDAVGEAYDKVSAILGLGYPGGPIIDALAAAGDPRAIAFPRTYLKRDSLDFSFSGLKTAVLYHVRGYQGKQRSPETLTDQDRANVSASFQAACIDVILEKLRRAIRHTGARCVIVGGGVSANRGLRAALPKLGLPIHIPPLRYCTDNAAMLAGLAALYFREKRFADLGLDAVTQSQFALP